MFHVTFTHEKVIIVYKKNEIAFCMSMRSCSIIPTTCINLKRQPSRIVLRKRCSEYMQQICRKTPMPTCDFNKFES